jgi:hypothetical protein
VNGRSTPAAAMLKITVANIASASEKPARILLLLANLI